MKFCSGQFAISHTQPNTPLEVKLIVCVFDATPIPVNKGYFAAVVVYSSTRLHPIGKTKYDWDETMFKSYQQLSNPIVENESINKLLFQFS